MSNFTAVAPYVHIVEQSIREDLSRVISQDKLDEEVRKTLIRQITVETGGAIQELNSAYTYGTDATRQKAEIKALRYMGYLQQTLGRVQTLRILPATTDVPEVMGVDNNTGEVF